LSDDDWDKEIEIISNWQRMSFWILSGLTLLCQKS